jgi:hypothetical protein
MEESIAWEVPFTLRCKVEAGKTKSVQNVQFVPHPGVIRFEDGVEELLLSTCSVLTLEKSGGKDDVHCFFCFSFPVLSATLHTSVPGNHHQR